jgi:hypothetical protein
MALLIPSLMDESQESTKWNQAETLLTNNPSAMTPRVLIVALQQQPPSHLIQFMLSINVEAARIPQEGFTPLQVALQSQTCSNDVIELLLKACPLALVVTKEGVDPLSYAKRHCRRNTQLIQLLQKPLGYWFQARSKDESGNKPPNDIVSIDRQEFNNVKLLCAQTIRGHEQLKESQTSEIQTVKDQQKVMCKYQLIALDMKEQAMRYSTKQVHDHCIQLCNEQIQAFKATMDDKIKEWESLMGQEAKLNANFRKDLMESAEGQQQPYLYTTYLEESKECLALLPLRDAKKRTRIPLLCKPFDGRNETDRN